MASLWIGPSTIDSDLLDELMMDGPGEGGVGNNGMDAVTLYFDNVKSHIKTASPRKTRRERRLSQDDYDTEIA